MCVGFQRRRRANPTAFVGSTACRGPRSGDRVLLGRAGRCGLGFSKSASTEPKGLRLREGQSPFRCYSDAPPVRCEKFQWPSVFGGRLAVPRLSGSSYDAGPTAGLAPTVRPVGGVRTGRTSRDSAHGNPNASHIPSSARPHNIGRDLGFGGSRDRIASLCPVGFDSCGSFLTALRILGKFLKFLCPLGLRARELWDLRSLEDTAMSSVPGRLALRCARQRDLVAHPPVTSMPYEPLPYRISRVDCSSSMGARFLRPAGLAPAEDLVFCSTESGSASFDASMSRGFQGRCGSHGGLVHRHRRRASMPGGISGCCGRLAHRYEPPTRRRFYALRALVPVGRWQCSTGCSTEWRFYALRALSAVALASSVFAPTLNSGFYALRAFRPVAARQWCVELDNVNGVFHACWL